jgi:predicted NBD/HSP70 family sugar kinase
VLEAKGHLRAHDVVTFRGQRPEDVRRNNRAVALELLRAQPRGRAELSREMNLSKPALGDLVTQLMNEGLVLERPPAPTSRGRHPAPLEINAKRFSVIGLDIVSHHPQHIEAGLYDASGQPLEVRVTESAVNDDREAMYAHTLKVVRGLIRDAKKFKAGTVVAVGAASPGPVDARRGTILSPPNFPELAGLDLVVRLERDLNLPARLERDVHAASVTYLFETRAENFVYILLGKGIGAGVVIARRVYRGVHGFAGEFGHVSIDHNGPTCPCGNRGCIERYVGSDAIQTHFAHLSRKRRGSLEMDTSKPDILEIADLARNGNKHAKTAFDTAGEALGLACVSLVNLLDPALIVLGGSGSAWADLIVPGLRAKLEERAYPFLGLGAHLPIEIAQLERPFGIGAAERVLEAIYQGEIPLPATTQSLASGPSGQKETVMT